MRNPFPSTAALLPLDCFSVPTACMFLLASCTPFLYTALPLDCHLLNSISQPPPFCPPKQMMPPMRPRSPSPSQPGQSAWPGSMHRSTSSNSERQREPADPHGLRAPVTAGNSRRRSSGSSESEPGPRRKNCVRAEQRGHRRLVGTEGQSQPGLGPGQNTQEEQGGVASGALAMCPGLALEEGTRRPWPQPSWPGAPPWRSRGP